MSSEPEQSGGDVAATIFDLQPDPAANRIQRARMQRHQPLNLVYGLTELANAAFGIAAIIVALIAIEPYLIPLVAAVLLPAWLAASRRGEAFYRFFWRWTPRDRERDYVAGLMGRRERLRERPHRRVRYARGADARRRRVRRAVHIASGGVPGQDGAARRHLTTPRLERRRSWDAPSYNL
jgi:hypothetical protein